MATNPSNPEADQELQGIVDDLRAEGRPNLAGMIEYLNGELTTARAKLDERDLHDELAREGIGQTPPIVLLCGDERGEDPFGYDDANLELTHTGHIVIEHEVRDDEDPDLMGLLLGQKVKLADLVHVHNSTGVQRRTQAIIDAATEAGVPVQYLNTPDQ